MLTTSFPRHERDVAGSFVLGFARALTQHGHAVEVLAPEPREPWPTPGWPSIRVRHVKYARPRALARTFYGAGVPDNLTADPLAWLGLAPFVLALTQRAYRCMPHWDACVSHWALPCAISLGLVRGTRPHLAVVHSADLHLLSRLPGRRRVAQRIAQGANALWFVSERHRAAFGALLPASTPMPRTIVRPMGVELPGATELARGRTLARRSYGLDGFTALCLSRLVPIKAVDQAIRAAARQGITLLIAGEGPERPRLEALARDLGAPVRFLGLITGPEKQRLLSAADAFVLSSRDLPSGRSEGLPTSVLEALSHGVPVIATRVGGLAELLSEPPLSRWLVPPNEPLSLSDALGALRSLPATARTALAESGRRVAERFAWSNLAPTALEVLSRSPSLGTVQGAGRGATATNPGRDGEAPVRSVP